MKASALMDQPEDCDPQRAIETLPPPDGAKHAYSAQTRVGTLPEHVLEAMRQHEPDAALEKRTKSGMLRAAARLLTPPAQPTFTAAAAPTATPTPIVLAPPRASSRRGERGAAYCDRSSWWRSSRCSPRSARLRLRFWDIEN